MAQLLVGHNLKNALKNSTKLHKTVFQHVFNYFVDFQSKWTTTVEMTIALKLGVQRSNIVDTSDIGCVWHALCMVYCSRIKKCLVFLWCQIVISNRCIATLSSYSDSNVQQTGLAQTDLPVVFLSQWL